MRSVAGTIPKYGSIRPPRARRQILLTPPAEYLTQLGPPDISCADISEEQMSRTYSQSCIWDPKTNPVPPMQEMKGFGRFRRSVHADADWELRKFRGELQTLGPAAVQHLGDFEIANLKTAVMNNIRTPSYTSLVSRSDSEETSTDPRICRGFDPSKTSIDAKLSKDRSRSTSRARSVAGSPDPIGESSVRWRPLIRRTPFLQFDNDAAALSTINETTATLPKKKKKRTVPLIFDTQETLDAVIDDDEYETCEESFAPGEISAKGERQSTSAMASNWHEKKAQTTHSEVLNRNRGIRHHRTFDVTQEKARMGQKRSTKPPVRRLSSRGVKALANRVTSKENIPRAVETKVEADFKTATPSSEPSSPFAVFISKHLPTSSDGSADGSAADVNLYMAEPKAPTTASKENDDTSHPSTANNQTVKPGAGRSSHTPTAQGPNKSNTSMRVISGNIPIIYVGDDVKQLLHMGEAEQKHMQLVAA
jgi:hypothetical protein